MDVHIRLGSTGDLTEQIFRQLRDAILDGRLRAGERLPPSRDLARRLAVARNTVGVAYERLVAEGIVAGRVGAGTFVTHEPLPRTAPRRAPAGQVPPRAVWRDVPVLATQASVRVPFDFGIGTPDHTRFPITVWRRLLSRELRSPAAVLSSYADPAGHPALRAAIARHIGVSRAVRASADDVLVTSGAQQAFDLIGRVLLDPGSTVAMEDPGYGRARLLFHTLGTRVAGVPVDDEGLIVDAIPPRARLVYVTPSHQFPTGVTMSLRRRTALLQWAERSGGVVVEDDYDSEFRFGGRPLDPLQSLDRAGRVIYVGSFSKVLLPGLRLGFLVAPASLQPALQAARQLADWHGDPAPQAALARFIDDGGLARHIRALTRDYAARYVRIAAGVEAHLGRWLRVVPASAGLHVAMRLTPQARLPLRDVVVAAAAEGLRIAALADFAIGPTAPDGLVLGFGRMPEARVDEGLTRLARVCASVARRQPRAAARRR